MNANLTEMEAALRRFERETPHSPAECALADALVCVLAELTDLYRVRECQREWEQRKIESFARAGLSNQSVSKDLEKPL
mgnify:CR=1 FL=1